MEEVLWGWRTRRHDRSSSKVVEGEGSALSKVTWCEGRHHSGALTSVCYLCHFWRLSVTLEISVTSLCHSWDQCDISLLLVTSVWHLSPSWHQCDISLSLLRSVWHVWDQTSLCHHISSLTSLKRSNISLTSGWHSGISLDISLSFWYRYDIFMSLWYQSDKYIYHSEISLICLCQSDQPDIFAILILVWYLSVNDIILFFHSCFDVSQWSWHADINLSYKTQTYQTDRLTSNHLIL